ncbi:hypothetical protein COO91_02165 [Nostoc flagelliforme CCNUN1]|uniref:Uncharacterized protein n=1 Tax=Nostoc flagelliforme CCNUN1 TaxID=2038116 RepID=A0A2K8SLE2_9NOSO|nr:hypothetical protein COO91_02165 [Nostoc flagelliforme CCNUN1]
MRIFSTIFDILKNLPLKDGALGIAYSSPISPLPTSHSFFIWN